MPIGPAPIDASVVWSGNTTGPAPWNVSWAVTIGGGGIPLYQVVVEFENWGGGAFQANSAAPNGSISLTTPGMYIGVAEVVDSTCDAVSASYLGPVTVYPSSGVDPVQISASVSGGPVPLAVQSTENASLAGPNESMVWTTPVSWESSGWSANATDYRAGNFTAVGCLVNASTAVYFACGTSGPVAVTGTLIQTSVAIGYGSLPVPIAFFVNLTNGSAFPSNWSVDLWTDNGTL
ncbi:MAG: hypothetical protein L3K16_09710 [Thermoplasmata archaeon]|nr:hypothetical protein [Thermoplasmata archaeon]